MLRRLLAFETFDFATWENAHRMQNGSAPGPYGSLLMQHCITFRAETAATQVDVCAEGCKMREHARAQFGSLSLTGLQD